jgi:Tol biopolymer transport system component/sugar lactone lactonase YvrE
MVMLLMNQARRIKLGLVVGAFLLMDALAAGCGSGLSCGDDSTSSSPSSSGSGSSPVIVISDQANNRLVQISDLHGNGWKESSGVPKSVNLTKIHLDSTGRIYMANAVNQPIATNGTIYRMDDMSGANLTGLGTPGSGTLQFNNPADVVVDAQNRIYIADAGNNRIVRVDDMTGANWAAFGTAGSGTGQFNQPRALCLDRAGHIYVADTGNFRIVRIDDMNGSGWTQSSTQAQVAMLDVFVDANNRIYFTYGTTIVRMDDLSGSGRVSYGPPGPADNNTPGTLGGVWVDSAGRIFLTDIDNSRIMRINDMNGAGRVVLGTKGSLTGEFTGPQGICVDPASGRIYVADTGNLRIARMDDMTGANWTVFNRFLQTHYASPSGVYATSAGDIFFTDTSNHRIMKIGGIDQSGYAGIGTQGSGVNQFNGPQGIFLDSSNAVYVADTGNHRIVRMDDISGKNWTSLGTQGSGRGQFSSPVGIFVDQQKHIYVADTGNSRIVRMDDMSGANWMTLTGPAGSSQSFAAPEGVCLDSSGRLYVADTGNARIVRADDMTGANWTAFGTAGSGANQFNAPHSIIGVSGNRGFYVTDFGNNRIVAFNDIQGGGWQPLGTSGGGVNQFQHPFGVFPTNVELGPPGGGGGGALVGSFTLAVDPTSGTVTPQGVSTPFTITVTPQQGFTGSVALAVTGAPAGLTVSDPNPATVTINSSAGATSQFSVQAGNAPPPSAQLTVTATSRGFTQTVHITVTSSASPGGKIVFNSYGQIASNIYAMNADGSNLTNLTNDPSGGEADPRLSADGQWIVFAKGRTSTSGNDIWIMRADGSSRTKVTPNFPGGANTDNTKPSFSPDGQRILFHYTTDQIAIMDRNGGNAQYLTRTGTGIYVFGGAVFSPDGRTIAFAGKIHNGVDFSTINLMNADGSNPRILYSLPGHDLYEPRFSKDGSHIVFVDLQTTESYPENIFTMDANGTNARQLTFDNRSQEPAFTGSGRIVFYRADAGQIYVMDANGGNVIPLTHSASGVQNLSPDSQ